MTKAGNSQTIRTITLLITILSLSFPTYAEYSGGTGELNDPYQIANAEDLILLGETPEDYDKHFILTSDIDMDPNLPGRKIFDKAVIAPDMKDEWLGFQGVYFTGVLDGNGHTIENLMIDGGHNVSLFGALYIGAEVKNLKLLRANISGGTTVGSLVGYCREGMITNCFVQSSYIRGQSNVGGLIGHLRYAKLIGSYSDVKVIGEKYIGGLVGQCAGSYEITECFASGDVIGEDAIGGLVGWSSQTVDSFPTPAIMNCYSACRVWGTSSVGGLVGLNNKGWILSCYAAGGVMGNKSGGLIGEGIETMTFGVSNSFWDINTTGQIESIGGTGLITADMQKASTFIKKGWDFDTVWSISEDSEYQYPLLQRFGSISPISEDLAYPPLTLNTMLIEPHISEGISDINIPIMVGRRDDLTNDTLVLISSSDPNELWVPDTVIIPAGFAVTEFKARLWNDPEIDGNKIVTVTIVDANFHVDLMDFTIEDDDSKNKTTIAGHWPGGLLQDGLYRVTADLIVNANQILEIEAGTLLQFEQGKSLRIGGTLRAEGQEDALITFASASDEPSSKDWIGIINLKETTPNLLLDHVIIAYANNGIEIYNGEGDPKVFLYNSEVHNCQNGVNIRARLNFSMHPERVIICYNRIYNNINHGIIMSAHRTANVGSGTNNSFVGYNDIFGNGSAGIYLGETGGGYIGSYHTRGRTECTLKANNIYNNGTGIYDTSRQRTEIVNNLVNANKSNGIAIIQDDAKPWIVNNTIAYNEGSGILHKIVKGPSVGVPFTVVNNIIIENGTGIECEAKQSVPNDLSVAEISHNCVFANSAGDWVNHDEVYGDFVTTNIAGTPADVHMNIGVDPLVVGLEDFHLQPTSPAVNAGIFIDGIVPTEDFDNDIRTEPIDIGFDEVVE